VEHDIVSMHKVARSMTLTHAVEAVLPSDHALIETMLDHAFGLARRAKTSYRLREGNQAVDGLSLVAREQGIGLSGAISFWPVSIGVAGVPALLLGPLVVHWQRQNRGIGLALMQKGLALAKGQGHRLVILVGDEPYYARVGFQRVPEGKLMLPGPVDTERLLYLELQEGAMAAANGLVLPPYRHAEIMPVQA
jgi:predicted N-acetyltransferase YhbS